MSEAPKQSEQAKPTSYEKTLASLKMLMQERGYIVIGIKPGREERYKIGQVLYEACGCDFDTLFTVTAETDHADWVQQCELVMERLGFTMKTISSGDAYYRAITSWQEIPDEQPIY